MKALLKDLIGTLLAGIAIFILFQLTLQHSIVDGSSMEPGLHNEQRLLVSKLAYRFGEPERGDIIIFPPPHIANPDKDYIKRIIGLPGETVEIKNGVIYINDSQLNEPYIAEAANGSLAKRTIPEGEYFVLGDNRNNSTDSRTGWTVPHQDIVGKAWLSIWPSASWGLAPNHKFLQEISGTLSQIYILLPGELKGVVE